MNSKGVRGIFEIAMAVALLCALAASCALLTGCGGRDESGPKAAVEQYYAALNEGDLEGMLACCDSTTNNMMNGSVSLLQGLLDASGSSGFDVREFVMGLYPSIGEAAKSQNVTCEFEPTDIKVDFSDDDHATVSDMLVISVTQDGETSETKQREEYELVKEEDEWKIDLSEQMQQALGAGLNIAGSLF